MKACLTIRGNDIFGSIEEHATEEIRITISNETRAKFKTWAQRYDRAVLSKESSPLLAIGAEMFGWMDANGWASKWAKGSGDRILEVAVDGDTPETAALLLDLPWEILVFEKDFLTADSVQAYVVHRRIGPCGGDNPLIPNYRDLTAMFMAAAPEGQHELDFEAEEAAILTATKRLPLQLLVEESGCIDFLEERLALEGPFDAVHLSCHGTIDPTKGPILLLEAAALTPGKLTSAPGQAKAPLVFLSACRTAECKYTNNEKGESEVVEPYVRSLIRAGVPNVLGWDGSVHDGDAILFAHIFYRKLAEFCTIPYAAAQARRDLLQVHRNAPQTGHHWHLARVYTGRQGGGSLCLRGKKKRKLTKGAGFKEFLDKANERVPAATAQQFVGRRRQAQKILRLLWENQHAGVLIYGMGNIGKSSLAARIANRLPQHKTTVIYEGYDSLAVFDQLLYALSGAERDVWQNQWREKIKNGDAALANVLEELLSGPFDKQPILLIIDDLEQILEEPLPEQHRTPVKKVFRAALTAVLQAFNAVDTESRLLLTSRFNFILPDKRGRDLADLLVPVQLPSIADRERVKLWQAAKRTTADEWEADLDEEREAAREALVTQIMAAAGGNPGLQEILCRPVLTGELKAAGDALAAVNHWKASGKIPTEESASQEFFQRVSFEIYQKALTETQATFLRTSTLFTENLPVPRPAVIALGNAAGIGDPQAALNRLIALGLVDHYGGNHLAANPLALTLVEKELSDTEQALLAADVISPLAKAWSDAEGVFPYDVRGVEAARLALLGNAPATVLEKASLAAGAFLFRQAHDADGALKIMTSALEHFDAENHPPDPYFFILAAQCAERIGETQQQRRLLTKGLKLQSDDKIAMAQVAVEHATATQSDDPVKALETLKKVAELFEQAQAVREKAVTMGQIADILTGRGETDEALRIHIEERLPIAEAMKDLDSIAHTRFSCAQIRLERGGMEQGEIQTIYDELVESFEINFKLQRVDGIAHSGMMLGQLLIMCGQSEDARILLKHSATAFEILQNPQQAQKIRNLLKQIEDVPYED